MEYELYHHGIKGMKWGVRRYQNKTGGLTSAGKKRYRKSAHEDYTKAHSKKNVKYMSDKELKERNTRLQMEQQYNQLTQRKKGAGEKFVKGVLVASGTAVATKYATQYITKGAEAVIKYGPVIVKGLKG